MLIQAGLNQKEEREFWCDVISTATKLDNIMVRTDRTKPPYTLFFNKDVKYLKHLRSFGETAVVAIHEGEDEIQIGYLRKNIRVYWVFR